MHSIFARAPDYDKKYGESEHRQSSPHVHLDFPSNLKSLRSLIVPGLTSNCLASASRLYPQISDWPQRHRIADTTNFSFEFLDSSEPFPVHPPLSLLSGGFLSPGVLSPSAAFLWSAARLPLSHYSLGGLRQDFPDVTNELQHA